MRRILARLLILCAVLLMPFGMAPVAAVAHHEMSAAMPMQHCPEQGGQHPAKGGFAECTMVCSSALPAADRVQEQPLPYEPPTVAPIALHVLRGLHPETATPPPKIA